MGLIGGDDRLCVSVCVRVRVLFSYVCLLLPVSSHRISTGEPYEKGKGLFLNRGKDFFTLDKSGGAETLLPTKNGARGDRPQLNFFHFFWRGLGGGA